MGKWGNTMKALAVLSFFLAAPAMANFSCHLEEYYSFEPAANRFAVDIKMNDEGEKIVGNLVIHRPYSPIEIEESVKKRSLIFQEGAEAQLDTAFSALGILDEVDSLEEYSFGPVTNMGVMAVVYRVFDRYGIELDQLVYLWGAPGYGSCKQQKLIAPFPTI